MTCSSVSIHSFHFIVIYMATTLFVIKIYSYEWETRRDEVLWAAIGLPLSHCQPAKVLHCWADVGLSLASSLGKEHLVPQLSLPLASLRKEVGFFLPCWIHTKRGKKSFLPREAEIYRGFEDRHLCPTGVQSACLTAPGFNAIWTIFAVLSIWMPFIRPNFKVYAD